MGQCAAADPQACQVLEGGRLMLGLDSIRAMFGRNKTLPADVSAAIEAAWIMERSSDQDGAPRVAVALGGLRAAFIWSEDEAARRLVRRFPELNDHQLRRAVKYLGARVAIVNAEQGRDPKRHERKTWLNRWRYQD